MGRCQKIVVVGDGACGKTCLSVAFCQNEFPEDHVPTIFDTYTKMLQVDDKNVELAIWDTAGEEDYDRLRPVTYSEADVFVVCFAIDNPTSLANVTEKWAPEVKHHRHKTPLILVGNKMDLRSNDEVIKNLQKKESHPVQYDEGMKVAKKIKARTYIECSAKFLMGVTDVFNMAAQIALETTAKKTQCKCIGM